MAVPSPLPREEGGIAHCDDRAHAQRCALYSGRIVFFFLLAHLLACTSFRLLHHAVMGGAV